MPLADDVFVSIILGDYVAIDAAGKLNILGGGFIMTSIQTTGTTVPMYVATIIDVPSEHLGHEFAVSVELRDLATDSVVMLTGPSGNLEALRVQQLFKADRMVGPGIYLPESMFGRCQSLLGFANGIPLTPGHTYAWSVEVNGQHRKPWIAKFHVLGPPPPPVIGGPAQSPSAEMPPL